MNKRKYENRAEEYRKTSLIIVYIAVVNLAVIIVCICLDCSHKDYICGLETFFCSVLTHRASLVSIFMTIWGIIITVTIFLAGRLDNLIYGISLREIIRWRFCRWHILVISVLYCYLLPLMLISILRTWPITLLSLLIIMLLDAIGFAGFVLWIVGSDNIREFIKKESLFQIGEILDTIEGEENTKSEYTVERKLEELPICILICNIDYENGRDRQYVLEVLEEICGQIKNRMVTGKECSKPQFHILLFPLLQKVVTYSGTKKLNKYRRTRILLCELLMRAIDYEEQGEKNEQTKGWAEANTLVGFVIIAAAIYSYPKDSSGNDIYELLHSLPWEIRPFTIFLLLAFIEYLYAGGDINSERLNSFAEYLGDIYPITDHDTYYAGNIRLYWHIWNHYNFGYWKEASLDCLKNFLDDYDKIRNKNYFGRSYVINQIKYGERDTWRAF